MLRRLAVTPIPRVPSHMPKPLAHFETALDTFHQQRARFNVFSVAVAMPSEQSPTVLETEFEYRVAEGALMRLACSERCFDSDSAVLQLQEATC